jgi:hypothetical protein
MASDLLYLSLSVGTNLRVLGREIMPFDKDNSKKPKLVIVDSSIVKSFDLSPRIIKSAELRSNTITSLKLDSFIPSNISLNLPSEKTAILGRKSSESGLRRTTIELKDLE